MTDIREFGNLLVDAGILHPNNNNPTNINGICNEATKIFTPAKFVNYKYVNMLNRGTIPTEQLLSTYHPVLFTHDPDCKRFFNNDHKEFYDKFPLRLDQGPELDDTQIKIKDNLPSCRFHNHETELVLPTSTLNNIPLYLPKNKEDHNDDQYVVHKIKLTVPKELNKIYRKWFAIHKKMYDASLAELAIDIGILQNGKRKLISKFELGTIMVRRFKIQMQEVGFPDCSASHTVFEAHKNYTASLKKKKAECKDKKDKKNLISIIEIDGECITNGIIYKTKVSNELKKVISGIGKNKTHQRKDQKSKIKHILQKSKINLFEEEQKTNPESFANRTVPNRKQQKLMLDRRSGKYYLIVCEINEPIVDLPRIDTIVAVDPGVSPFMNFYSTKVHGSIGGGIIKHSVGRLHDQMDDLKQRINNPPEGLTSKQRYFRKSKLKRQCGNKSIKVQDIVRNLHNKSANFFAKNFQYIFLPELRTGKKKDESIPKCVRRSLKTSSQYRFREKLIEKCKQFRSTVIFCEEYYTTQTCTRCGSTYYPGGDKIYDCKYCGLTIDRDYNSARNILIKNITSGGSLPIL